MAYYEGTEFPAYKFVEFPKWVKDAQGTDVLVQTAEQEAELAPKAKIDLTKKG
jgi:hypothetical protein